MTTTRIALCGLGQMGLPVASRLATAHEVLAYDLAEERRALAEAHERVSTTDRLDDLAACDTIVLCLPNPAVSRSVLGDLAGEIARGTLVVETSTVLPHDVRECARLLDPVGARVLDAAILSGVAQMEGGTATLLVGGSAIDIDAARSVLDALGGAGWSRLGDLGAGMAAKVVNNGVAHAGDRRSPVGSGNYAGGSGLAAGIVFGRRSGSAAEQRSAARQRPEDVRAHGDRRVRADP